jgi:hypothetical protein
MLFLFLLEMTQQLLLSVDAISFLNVAAEYCAPGTARADEGATSAACCFVYLFNPDKSA